MRIVHLNTSAQKGGASQAVGRLHRALCSADVDSKMLVQFGAAADDGGVSGPLSKSAKASALLRDVGAVLPLLPFRIWPSDVFSAQLVPSRTARDVGVLDPDLVHLHWVCAGFVPIHLLRRFQKPLIWTLHDMWPMTGGCHHARDCSGFEDACGNCPVLNSHHAMDLSRLVHRVKARSWRGLDIQLIAPSHWMAEQARRSKLFSDRPITVIANGVDLESYRPWDQQMARDILGLPDGPLILFSAANGLQAPYKGGDVVQQAVAALRAKGVEATLVVMGGKRQTRSPSHLPVHWLGHLYDDASRALAYAAADVSISCSSEDNLPSSISESLACGTPVVAYDVGGVSDMLDDGVNGYLLRQGDVAGLVQGVTAAIARRRELSPAARDKAERCFDIRNVALQHRELYETLIGR